MKFFRRQPAPTAATAPSAPVRPGEAATPADIVLAYRLILKREVDPDGLAAYTQRLREGLSLEQLLQSLLDSPERETRLQRGDSQPQSAPQPAADQSVIDPKEVMRRFSVEALNETADEYYRLVLMADNGGQFYSRENAPGINY